MKHADKTHCKRGHEFTPNNTIILVKKYGNGKTSKGRACRECGYIRQREYNARQGGATTAYVGHPDNLKEGE
jgi:hypothetical protein